MGINAREIVIHTSKAMIFSVRTCFQSIYYHPLVFVMAILSFLLYRFLPSVFSFFITSSPVIVCTALLLGTLLCFGEPNIPAKEEEKEMIASRPSSSRAVDEKDENFSVKNHLERRREVDEKKISEERQHLEEKKPIERIAEVIKSVERDKKKEISDLKSKNEIVDESSDSEFNSEGSSSPDESVADADAPRMPDEIHPLLDSGSPQRPAFEPDQDSESVNESDEAENLEEEEEEAEEEDREDTTAAAVVKWTEDDAKNLIDLGTSELERNQRLENLIEKRIARKKSQKVEAEKNLIDLDGNDPAPASTPIGYQFAQIQIQVPPVSTSRQQQQNPFDLPYSPYSQIPGSAPSVLLTRGNPFDIPHSPSPAQSSNLSVGNSNSSTEFKLKPPIPLQQQQQKEFFFRRHESFTLGASSLPSEIKQQRLLKPYFVPERSATSLQPQLSGIADSKEESTDSDTDTTDTASSVIGHEDQEELLEEEFNLELESISRVDSAAAAEQTDQENVSSDEADSEEVVERDPNPADSGGAQKTKLNGSDVDDEKSEASSSSSDGGDAPKGSIKSIRLAPVEGPVLEPVYDSSPSAAAAAAAAKSIASVDGEAWVAPPSLSTFDQVESKSKGVPEIKETDVIRVVDPSSEAEKRETHEVGPQSNDEGQKKSEPSIMDLSGGPSTERVQKEEQPQV